MPTKDAEPTAALFSRVTRKTYTVTVYVATDRHIVASIETDHSPFYGAGRTEKEALANLGRAFIENEGGQPVD